MKSLQSELRHAPVVTASSETLRDDAEAIMNTLMWRLGARMRHLVDDEQDTLSDAISAPPLHNYPGPGFAHMTTEAWNRVPVNCRGTWMESSLDGVAPRRVRVAVTADADMMPVYLTDSVRTDLPGISA